MGPLCSSHKASHQDTGQEGFPNLHFSCVLGYPRNPVRIEFQPSDLVKVELVLLGSVQESRTCSVNLCQVPMVSDSVERCACAALWCLQLLGTTASWESHADIYRPLSTITACVSGNRKCLSHSCRLRAHEVLRNKTLSNAAHTQVTRLVPR